MRKNVGLLAALASLSSLLIATSVGAAQKYLMTGKFARSAGVAIDLPLIGNNPGGVPNCGQTLMGGTMVPGMSPIYQGQRSAIVTTMVATPPFTANAMVGTMNVPWRTRFANPHGCVSLAGKVTATAAGAGKVFYFPTMAVTKPFPGMTVAVHIPLLSSIVQLASSAKFTGPAKSLPMTGSDVPNGTMNNGANTAPFRRFFKSAWKGGTMGSFKGQTGRAGSMFTWCFGNPNCTMVSQAKGYPNTDPFTGDPKHEVFVKYTPGPNKFGGTMSHIVTAGPNKSSLAISAGGAVQFLGLTVKGSVPTGRGYADYLTDPIMGGEKFASFDVGPVYVPALMSFQNLITHLGPMVPGTGGTNLTITRNKNFGFPFTTGTVVARNTGKDLQNNAVVVTLTGMGFDCVGAKGPSCSIATGMGARNISLVAGAVAAVDLLGSETPYMVQMFLPEPGMPASMIAGVVVLLGIAASRTRRRVR